VLHPLAWFATGRQGGDSWRPMSRAYAYAATLEQRSKPLYDKMFFSPAVEHKGYQYPPTALLAVSMARLLAGERFYAALEWITWAFIPVTVLFVIGIHQRSAESAGVAAPGSATERWALLSILAVLALSFYPAIRAYRNGQIQTWINAFFAIALWAALRGSTGLAGLLAGAMCLIKPQYAVLGLWGVLRGKWRFSLAWAAVVALGLLVSVALFGMAPHVGYADVLAFIARRGESFYPNQSFNGALNRLFGNGESAAWMKQFPPPHPWVYAGTLITSAALLLWGLLGRVSPRERGGPADFCAIGLASTIASPIAWEHHYGVALPVFAFLWPVLAARPALGPRRVALLAVSYGLCSNSFMITNAFADTPLNPLQSYRLAAGLVVLWLLDRLRRDASR
jgi:hypothetical protein